MTTKSDNEFGELRSSELYGTDSSLNLPEGMEYFELFEKNKSIEFNAVDFIDDDDGNDDDDVDREQDDDEDELLVMNDDEHQYSFDEDGLEASLEEKAQLPYMVTPTSLLTSTLHILSTCESCLSYK